MFTANGTRVKRCEYKEAANYFHVSLKYSVKREAECSTCINDKQ